MPEPPPFPVPTDEFTITFGPCANLMIYTGNESSRESCSTVSDALVQLVMSDVMSPGENCH